MGFVSRTIGHFAAERLRVELRPASVTLSRHAVFPRSRVISTRSIEVTSAAGSSEHPPEAWRASLDTLASVLREQRSPVGRVEVVLSDHFVRYALIPWSENLVADSERLGFARLGFRNVYAHVSDGWDVCVDEQPGTKGIDDGRIFQLCQLGRHLHSERRHGLWRVRHIEGNIECVAAGRQRRETLDRGSGLTSNQE